MVALLQQIAKVVVTQLSGVENCCSVPIGTI
jgi:hypothetical protein